MDPDGDPPPIPFHSHPTSPTVAPSSSAATSAAYDDQLRESAGTPTQGLRNKVTYYEKVWSSGQKRSADDVDDTDHTFAIDVNAFEKRLKEERERKFFEHSPRIDVQLRSTPQPSPRPTNINISIRHHVEQQQQPQQPSIIAGGASSSSNIATPVSTSPSDTYEEHVEHLHEGGEIKSHARVLKFEKIVVKKSVREVNVVRSGSSSSSSPTSRNIEFFSAMRHTPSDEHIAADSAYQSQRSHLVSTHSSQSSSSASLHGNFTSDENVFRQRTPSRERMHGNEQHSIVSWSNTSGVGGTTITIPIGGNASSNVSSPNTSRSRTASNSAANTPISVSSVAGGNPVNRRHLSFERHGSELEASSPDWYNEYRAQSFHTVAPRMEFKRSNSQYDSHIKQIRGTYLIGQMHIYFCFSFITNKN